jgi:hypothetical protein
MAGIVTVSYSGTVNTVSPLATQRTGVVVGDTITGSFSYDSTQTGSIQTGIYTFTGSAKVHTMSFKIFDVNHNQVFSDSYTPGNSGYYVAKVTSNNVDGARLRLEGDTVYKASLNPPVTGPGPPPAFAITLLNPTNAGGFSPTNLPLPTTVTIANFVKTTAILDWDPSGQSFQARVFGVVVPPVPEPPSLVLSLLAVAGCAAGFRVCRRKPAAALVG